MDWENVANEVKKTVGECKAIYGHLQENNKLLDELSNNKSKSDDQRDSESNSGNREESKQGTRPWTEEEDRLLFRLYKEKGSVWSAIARNFSGRTENNLKNRFYSTLRRIARKKAKGLTNAELINKISHNILDYVDEALETGHNCFSKRGRPKKGLSLRSDKKQKLKMESPGPSTPPAAVPDPPVPQISPAVLNAQVIPQETHREAPSEGASLPVPEQLAQYAKSDSDLHNKLVELVNLQQSIIDLLLSRAGLAKPVTRSPDQSESS